MSTRLLAGCLVALALAAVWTPRTPGRAFGSGAGAVDGRRAEATILLHVR